MIKKVLGLFLAVMMLMGFNIISYAANDSGKIELSKLDKIGNLTDMAKDIENKKGIVTPMLWTGEKLPQVTSIDLYDYGTLENGNFAVIIEVMGYGREDTYFNGNKISYIQNSPIVLYGTGADGFLYLYDCGEITNSGNYLFKTTFTSQEYPYSKVSASYPFDITVDWVKSFL